MSASLYSLSKEYLKSFQTLEDLLNNEDIAPEEIEQADKELELTKDNIKEKALKYLQYIKTLESEVFGIICEKKRLEALEKSKKNLIENLTNRLKTSLISLDIDKLDLNTFKLSISKSESTEVDALEKTLKELNLKNVLNSDFKADSIIKKIKENEELKAFADFLSISIDFSISKTKIKAFIEDGEGNKVQGCFIDKKQTLKIK